MLKNLRYEILIIIVLLILVSLFHNIDIGLYKYFIFNKDSFQQIYIKKFFENITVLGDSLWYLLILIFLILSIHILIKNKFFNKYKNFFTTIQSFNYLFVLSILVSGALTQLLKHLIGRPRPNSLVEKNEYALKFLTADSGFHSFPSGHTSTIFVVALMLILLAPKLKYFFYFMATTISLSRVFVGAHFLTDIIGGITIAFIGFKLSKFILSRYYGFNNNKLVSLAINNNFILVIFFFLLSSILLAVGPSFDIFFSGLFYLDKNQFLVQSYYFVAILFRKIILILILIYILILPIISFYAPIKKIYFGYNFKIKKIIYIWVTALFSLVFVVNIILKNIWGRARPNEIFEMGGKNTFTPWYQISTQCDLNCSFVSGDAAVGFSLVVFYFIIKRELYLWLSLLLGFSIGGIRIMEGGHFISDVIFSCLVVFLFNFIIYSYFSKKINE